MRKKKFEEDMKAIKEDLSTHAEAKVVDEVVEVKEDPLLVIIREMREEMRKTNELLLETQKLVQSLRDRFV